MKILFRSLGVIMISLFATGLYAQQGGGMRNMDPEQTATRSLNTMKEIVKITDKEEVKVKEIFLNAAKAQQKEFQSMGQGGDREQMREKMAEMNKKRDAELEKVLGKERMEKYTKEMEKRRQERANGRGQR